MNDWQYEDFQQACALIDTIKTAKDFYRVIDIVFRATFLIALIAANGRRSAVGDPRLVL